MRKTNLLFISFLLLSFVLYSCGSDAAEKEKQEDDGVNISIGEDGFKLKIKDKNGDGKNVDIDINEKDLEEGINKLFGGDEDIDLVDFRELKEMLPSSLRGMERTSFEGQKAGIGRLKAATAEAVYKDGDEKIEISIVDAGGMGMMMASVAGWANIDVDNESDHGYERTTTIQGHKAFESYDSESKDGSIAVIVEKRILVAISGQNVSEKQLKKALGEINLKKLARKVR